MTPEERAAMEQGLWTLRKHQKDLETQLRQTKKAIQSIKACLAIRVTK